MSVEYGLITGEMKEKDIMAAISKLLEEYFRGRKENVQYDVYKNHKLMKHKNRGGISFNLDKIEWDYEYSYDYYNNPLGVLIEIYPNTNDEGARKFKIDGVMWNMYFNGAAFGTKAKNSTSKPVVDFLHFLLENMSCETVLIKEYAQGEDRL
ncbi:MAG: hypothetical protein IJD85_09550 [Oscillospiraceae bacterium]|nr:hypothetical protein [Oscillospiraceae bacterium]